MHRGVGSLFLRALGISERFNMFIKARDVVHIVPTSPEGHFFHLTFIVRLITQHLSSLTFHPLAVFFLSHLILSGRLSLAFKRAANSLKLLVRLQTIHVKFRSLDNHLHT